jgi:putative hydrolase of the HAD superfamily
VTRVRAVVYDFHHTLARPVDPRGLWAPSLADAIARARGDRAAVDLEAARRELRSGYPWDEPETRTHHATREASHASFVAILARAAGPAGAPPGSEQVVAEAAFAQISAHATYELYPETSEVLEAVDAAGIRQVVLSNHHWDIPETCEALGLVPPLALVLTSARLGAEKPHPATYAAAIEAAGAAPDEILFVGDSYDCDVAGPSAAGMRTLLVRGSDDRAPDAAPDLRGVLARVGSRR